MKTYTVQLQAPVSFTEEVEAMSYEEAEREAENLVGNVYENAPEPQRNYYVTDAIVMHN